MSEFASAALLVGTWGVGVALDAALVGIALYSIFFKRSDVPFGVRFVVVLAFMVIYNLWTLPAIIALDAKMVIGSAVVQAWLNGERVISLQDLYGNPGVVDVAIWLVQTGAANAIGARVVKPRAPIVAPR